MKNQPLMLSILLGIMLLLIIGGISISAKLSFTSKQYRKTLDKMIDLEKSQQQVSLQYEQTATKIEELERTNTKLKTRVDELSKNNTSLNLELEELKILKNKLEDDLKAELMKKKRKR
jgi:predicted RNase H-like nuclease (RuvC/YqgF family)